MDGSSKAASNRMNRIALSDLAATMRDRGGFRKSFSAYRVYS
jgi:hypothetical protein